MKFWGKTILGNYDGKAKPVGIYSQINEIKFEKGATGYLVL